MDNLIQGKIVKINKGIYTVLLKDNLFCECIIRGKLRFNKIDPTVGDNVIINSNTYTIEEILPRKNSLIRPLVSNIDSLLIVTSTKIPVFSSYLLDKLIVLSLQNDIEPIIIFTKLDLLSFKEKQNINKYKKYYKSLGYKVFTNRDIFFIKRLFKNKTVALTGQTGAGKSTLLNKIDKKLELKTDDISYSLKRGKHTTRIVELLSINKGLVADTPGFSALELKMDKQDLKHYFKELDISCKYKTCLHKNEEGCNINKILKTDISKERYNNYLKLLSEV